MQALWSKHNEIWHLWGQEKKLKSAEQQIIIFHIWLIHYNCQADVYVWSTLPTLFYNHTALLTALYTSYRAVNILVCSLTHRWLVCYYSHYIKQGDMPAHISPISAWALPPLCLRANPALPAPFLSQDEFDTTVLGLKFINFPSDIH